MAATSPAAIRRVTALVNPLAGSVKTVGADHVVALLKASLPTGARIVLVEGAVQAALDDAFQDGPDAVVIVGGDGTQCAAAARGAEADIPIAPLPGGTLNILPKKAFGERSLEESIASLKDAPVRRLTAGRADGKLFLVAACVGPIVRIAALREAARTGDFTRRVWQSVRYVAARAHRRSFAYRTLERGWTNAHALIVSTGDVEGAFGRPTDAQTANGGPLEAAAVTFAGWGDVGRVTAAALMGGWRQFENIASWETARTELDGRGHPLPAMLDGEATSLSARAVIAHDPKGVAIWAPPLEPNAA